MIWNDEKITRLMSIGLMHSIEADSESAGQQGESTSGGGADVGGIGGGSGPGGGGGGGGGGQEGGELSVDLGGGVTIGVDARTGDVTSTSGPDISGGAFGTAAREAGLQAGQALSDFGQFLSNLSPQKKGAAIGALGGALFGVGPLAGAQIGGAIGGKFGPEQTGLTQGPPGSRPGQQTTEQAQTQAQAPSLAGIAPASGLAGQALGQGQPGGEGQQAVQLAAAGRGSGVQPVAQQAQPNLGGQLPQFLSRQGPLPTVNLQAFPGALGRIG